MDTASNYLTGFEFFFIFAGADNTILHSFPNPDKEYDRFNTWKNAIGGSDVLSLDDQNIFRLRKVCHSHFEQRYHTWGKRLSANAVPTLHLTGKIILEIY